MSDRYARQVALAPVGARGQQRLAAARVLVVGAGGLGCPVLAQLAGAGVGHLRVVDGDRVERGNLHRQMLYLEADVGRRKVDAARAALTARNGEVHIEALALWLNPANAAALVADMDVVVDAGDNRALTYVLDAACADAGVALVSASALGLRGHVGVFGGAGPRYGAVFPDMPERAESCSSSGVLGPVVGLLGSLQAQLVLQLLLGVGVDPHGLLWRFDAERGDFARIDCRAAPMPNTPPLRFLAPQELDAADQVLELRPLREAPVAAVPQALRILPADLPLRFDELERSRPVVPCCQSGLRAWHAARTLQQAGFDCSGVLAMGLFAPVPRA